MIYDTLIRGGRWFDGTGAPSGVRDLGIVDGVVRTVSATPLAAGPETTVIDADGAWVMPGMIDIHTHYDVEVFEGPGLEESVRHGVTTILIGSCSLSTVHVDPVEAGDLFGRVEAIPRRHVIATLKKHQDWAGPVEYLSSLERLPLGPNLAAFIGHSDIRTAVMGLDRATRSTVRPTAAEMAEMECMLTAALDAGFVGMSSQRLLFDKLDGDVCRSRTLPSTYAHFRERMRLNGILRRRRRAAQLAPDATRPHTVVTSALSSMGIGRPGLRTSMLAASDVKSNPVAVYPLLALGSLVNALRGDLRWQHLPVPFEVYADGIDLVVFEEFGSGEAALHLADSADARNDLLRDETYRAWFRKDYDKRFGLRVWQRDFFDADIVACPDEQVVGRSFGQVSVEEGRHPVDTFLDLVLAHGTGLRWRTTISNHRPKVLRRLAVSPNIQMGFSDAGAHLRNMAFYNSGLRFLRHVRDAEAAGEGFMTLEQAAHRLTGELADWYRIDAGHLRPGSRADLVVIDPGNLDNSLEDYAEEPVEQYDGLRRMVNRNDAAVRAVLVSGRCVVRNGRPTEILGRQRTGSFLRAEQPAGPGLPEPALAGHES